MLGVFVKPFFAAISVKIIDLSLVFAGPARLFGRSRCNWQAARRVYCHAGREVSLVGTGSALNRPCRRFGKETLRIFVELLIAGERAEVIGFPFIVAGEA